MKRIWIAAIMLPVLAALLCAGLLGRTAARAEEDRIEAWAASVVRLEVFDRSGGRIGTGSGFAAFDPPALVTARHVIVNMEYMIATRDDGSAFRIDRAVAEDEAADIALCALPEDAALDPLPWAGDDPARGAAAIAIGSQFGLVNLVTTGNVCGVWDTEDVDWILYTSPVSAGCSGGPLLNDSGEVMGIITGSYEKGQNLNLAAPAEAAIALYRTTTVEGGTSK